MEQSTMNIAVGLGPEPFKRTPFLACQAYHHSQYRGLQRVSFGPIMIQHILSDVKHPSRTVDISYMFVYKGTSRFTRDLL